jgi:hypothetical protein
MHKHISSAHGHKPAEHKRSPLWKECILQTYFTRHGRIDYFVLVSAKTESSFAVAGKQDTGPSLSQPEKKLFQKLEQDFQIANDDLEKQAGVVRDFESKLERIPWLNTTRFAWYLAFLKDEKIQASYKMPHKEIGEEIDAKDATLMKILAGAEAVFQEAYMLCSDRSPDRKMTQQRANILNEFYAGALGKATGFCLYKNVSTLVKYSTMLKQLLTYYYHVVYYQDGHFTPTTTDQTLPQGTL